MYYLNIGCGFTNQIFCLITGIIDAYKKGEKVVVVGEFLNDIYKTKWTSIQDILNINEINIFLKKYNIIIVDKNNIKFDILSVKYGIDEKNNIDVTQEFIKNFYKNNVLQVDKNFSFNNLKGDPCYGIPKKLFFQYNINDYIIEEIYDEYLTKNIVIDFNSQNNFLLWSIDKFNDNMFEKILLNIKYVDDFIIKANSFTNTLNLNNKMNVIHLRLEDDAIKHWSRQNNMTYNDYKLYLENKYINIIKKYTLESQDNILLCSDSSNSVIDFMKNNNYSFKLITKFFDDREKNAIIELLVSRCCNNIYIGNFNIKNLNGSTFSYYVGKNMKEDVMKICIDLDKICDKEEITYKY
jgi:hypothetical protein